MDYQLQLKPFERKDGVKYKILQITDIALHTAHKQPTKSIGKKVRQSFNHEKPSRIYSTIINKESENHNTNIVLPLDLLQKDPEFIKMIQEEERKGYKILISLPKNGIPVVAGKDTEDFIKSKNGQRIIRKLAKNKNVD